MCVEGGGGGGGVTITHMQTLEMKSTLLHSACMSITKNIYPFQELRHMKEDEELN